MRISRQAILEILLFHFFLFLYWLTFPFKDEWWPTILLVVMVGILVLLEYRRTGLFIAPLLIWYVFWLGVISVGRMDLHLYPFYQTWSRKLLNVVLINTAVFFWLYWIGELFSSAFSKRSGKVSEENIHGELLAFLTFGILCVSVAAYAANVAYKGYIPQLTGDANSYRQSFVLSPFYRIVNLLRFVFAIVPVAVAGTKIRSMKLALVVLTAVLMAMEMLSGWRSYTLQAMVLLLTSLFIVMKNGDRNNGKGQKRKNNSKKALPIVFAACSLTLLFIGYIAVTRDSVGGALRTKLRYVVYILDMYIAPNFLNFQSGMNDLAVLGYPLYTAEAFWGLVTSWEKLPPYPPIDQAIGAFNVSTYLLQPYVDLGIPGTVLWSAIAGLAAGLVFRNCISNTKSCRMILLGIVNFAILVMHNNFFFRASSTVLWIVAGLCIDFLLYRKGKKI